MLDNVGYDIRYAVRALWRSPGFATAAILTVALGIGANTGIFSVLNGALLRDLPVAAAHELVSIERSVAGAPSGPHWGVPSAVPTNEYEAYRDRARTLSGVMGFSSPFEATLGEGAPREISGTFVTCGYFAVLQRPPARGRDLASRDCEEGAEPVVVLGHALWTTAFDADPAVIGRSIVLNRRLFTVIGVAPEGMRGVSLTSVELFAPISTLPLLRPDLAASSEGRYPLSWLSLVGRRAAGSSLEETRAELEVIAAQLDTQQPGRSTTLTIRRASVSPGGLLSTIGAAAMAAFALVLLIACANVANLLLTRATARSQEIATRLSLGATRARIVRQLMTESVLIFGAGGVVGSVLAVWSFEGLTAMVLSSLAAVGLPPIYIDTSPDLNVLAFAAALSLGTGVLFGLAPALHVTKPDLHGAAKPDATRLGSRASGRLRASFVGIQVALCMVLLVGAALSLRGLHAAESAEPGFEYRDIAVVSVDPTAAGYDDVEAGEFRRRLIDRIAALPGVEAVASASATPMSMENGVGEFRPAEGGLERFRFNLVSPGYFSLIGTPLVAGRTFMEAELRPGASVAIVTEATARRLWPYQDPVGRVLIREWRVGSIEYSTEYRIIGVVRDAEVRTVGEVPASFLYLPADPRLARQLLVRSRADFVFTAAGIRAAVAALDPGLVVRVAPLENNLVLQQTLSRLVTTLAATLGVLALVLAAVGIYGVVSYAVVQRYRELGVRIALGARPRRLLVSMLRQTMWPAALGAAAGFAAALAMSESLTAVLYGVDPADPLALGGAAAFLVGVALTAAWLAGRRAADADPMAALRHQ